MSPSRRALMTAALATPVALASRAAQACLWERDTLVIERRGLPGVLESILGLVPWNAPEVYRARIAALAPRETALSAAELDDLAVAHERLGERTEAERLLRESLARHGERYETLANLGTVLVHDGRPGEGLPLLEQAVALNPQAHFGREWVQIALIRWMTSEEQSAQPPFLASEMPDEEHQDKEDRALEGLLGIIAMGGPPHPLVYQVLASELGLQGRGVLALYAEQRALELDPDGGRTHQVAFLGQWEGGVPDVHAEFQRMRTAADQWVGAWQGWQRAELLEGRDPTLEGVYEDYLRDHPLPKLEESATYRLRYPAHTTGPVALGALAVAGAAGLAGAGLAGVLLWRRRAGG